MLRHAVTRLGDTAMLHCNMFSHLKVKQVEDVHYRSSVARHARLDSKLDLMKTEEDVRFWLGDNEGELAVFRTKNKSEDVLLTLATGRARPRLVMMKCFQEYLIWKRRK